MRNNLVTVLHTERYLAICGIPKGSECEFRHSESARLNLTECRYWLNGNCLNPNCGFRHLPLEGITESASNLVQFPVHSAVLTIKSNVPCRYHLNSRCIKGDQCPFLHDAASAQKLSEVALEAIAIHPPEIKTSSVSGTEPAPVVVPPNPSDDASKLIKQTQSKELHNVSGYAIPGSLYDQTIHDSYDHLANRHAPEYFERDSEHSTERFLDPVSYQKRRLSPRQHDVNDGGVVDLRDHLRKQMKMDVHQAGHNSQNHCPSLTSSSSREQPVRHETDPLLHSRLASVVEKNMIGFPYSESEFLQTYCHSNARSSHGKRKIWRRHGKPGPGSSSDFSQDLFLKEAISSQVVTTGFTLGEEKRGPKYGGNGSGSRMSCHQRRPEAEDSEGLKSLSKVFKKKRRPKAGGNGSRSCISCHKRSVAEDFEGPKSLSELLKEKRRNAPTSANTSSPVSTDSEPEQVEPMVS